MYTYQNGPSKFIPIAPMMSKNLDNREPTTYNYNSVTSGVQAASIAKRNARERNRVKQVNDGFNALRKRLPAAVIETLSGGARRGSGKKLSKVDTLRMVVEYIRYLEQMIDDNDSALGVSDEKPGYTMDEGIFTESDSTNSESMPSPAASDTYSRVSCYSEEDYYVNNYSTHNVNTMELGHLDLLW